MRTAQEGKIRKIVTPHFGEIDIEDKHIFSFDEGMLGFESLSEFVLISEEETEPFKWLISLKNPDIGFPLISPWYLDMNYKPGRNFNIDNQVVFVVITLQDSDGNMSANLKAPIILDVEKQKGEQIIIPSDKYQTNFVLPTKK